MQKKNWVEIKTFDARNRHDDKLGILVDQLLEHKDSVKNDPKFDIREAMKRSRKALSDDNCDPKEHSSEPTAAESDLHYSQLSNASDPTNFEHGAPK